MLECNVILTLFLHIIYAYIHFICLFLLIQMQNTEIYTVYRKSAKKYRYINFCSYRPALLPCYCNIYPFLLI